MPKSSKPKKEKPSSKSISVGGDVSNSVLIVGDKNMVNFQFEQIKTTYGLFTIPKPVIDFTGREQDLEQLKESFSRGAIITGVSGAGGIGKTELARKLAHDIADNYPDARISIDLQGTSEKPVSSEDAMRRLLEPFHVGQKLPDNESQLIGLYQQTFGRKKVLLLLDNAANAAQVRQLIPPVPSAAIITSRQHFSLTEFGLHEPVRLDVLSPEKARDLLSSASPMLINSSEIEVDKLAKLCGYLPLALRVAASLLNDRPDWTLETLAIRLQDEHTRLKRLKRYSDYDVEAVLNLSYELLDDESKRYFRFLGVFTAPFAKISAMAVLGIENDSELDDVLGSLIGRSLLNCQKSQEIVDYLYSMHDLTRLCALQRLLEEKEYEEILTRHATQLLQLMKFAQDEFDKGGNHRSFGLSLFSFFWEHSYSVFTRLLPDQKVYPRPQIADHWLITLAYYCVSFLRLQVSSQEQIFILQTAVEAARKLGDKQAEAAHLNHLGSAYKDAGFLEKAAVFYEKALEINQEINNRLYEAVVMGNLAFVLIELGDSRRALDLGEKALDMSREFGLKSDQARNLQTLGYSYLSVGDENKALDFFEQGLLLARESGDRLTEGHCLYALGVTHTDYLTDPLKGSQLFEDAFAIFTEIGDFYSVGFTLESLGVAFRKMVDIPKCVYFFEKALSVFREKGYRFHEARILTGIGGVYHEINEFNKAILSFQEALDIFQEIGEHHEVEAQAFANLGIVYNAVSNIKETIKCWQKAKEIYYVLNNPQAKIIEGWIFDLNKEI